MAQWVQEGDRKRCVRHDEWFTPPKACPHCFADPGPAPEADGVAPVPPAPLGCLTTIDIERAFVEDADAMRKEIRELSVASKVKDTHVYNSIAKLQDARTKLLRAAAEMAERREDETLLVDRLRRQRELRGHH